MKSLRWLTLASACLFTTAGSCDDGSTSPGEAGSGGQQAGSGGSGAAGSGGDPGGSGGTGGTGGIGGSGGTAGTGGTAGSGGTGVEPSCDAPTALPIPSTTKQTIAAGGVTCLDLELAAKQAVHIDALGISKAAGTIRLREPGGDVIATRGYGFGSTGKGRLFLGVAAAGTYLLEITNTGTENGEIAQLTVELLTPEILGVPDSATFTVGASKSVRYMIEPAPGQTYAARLSQAAVSGEIGFRNDPSGSTLLTAANRPGALVHRAHPAVLPVYEVFRNQGGDEPITLETLVPDPVPFDQDVPVTTPAINGLQVLTFEGTAGAAWSSGLEYDLGQRISPSASVFSPDGTAADGVPQRVSQGVHAFPITGPYTVEVRNTLGVAGESFLVRFNHVGDPEPMLPVERFEVTYDLVLGEVRRWSLDVTQAQVFGLELATPTTLDVTSILEGGNADVPFLDSSGGPAPRNLSGPARYVQKSAPAIFSVYGTGRYTGRTTGQVTAVLKRPDPEPAAVGTRITGTAGAHELLTWALDVDANLRHRMCWSYEGPLQSGFSVIQLVVWGPSAPYVNYSGGDLAANANSTSGEDTGLLRAGRNTLSLMNFAAAPIPFTVLVANLEDPLDLVPGAAAKNGTVDPCERDYFKVAGTKDTAYTVRATAAFDGAVRVYKLVPNGDFTSTAATVAGFPQALSSGVERVAAFTADATATYVVEVDAPGDVTGSYSVGLSSP